MSTQATDKKFSPGFSSITIIIVIIQGVIFPDALSKIIPPDASQIGVIGAGTMGSGIALAALLSDIKVVLYDIELSMLERAGHYIEEHLNRKRRAINIKYLALTQSLDDMSKTGFIVEAAPEILTLKQELFSRLDAICPPPTVLATNTSTLPVTAIASVTEHPERVAGMHFFNPAPVMPLVEVVKGAQSNDETLRAVCSLAEKMGKTPLVTSDTPGFIVNRVARPFYGEALRLLGEGVASHEQIDRIVRLGGGFRMGPFELMDLIGVDVNFTATQSMFEQSFSEPRYRPHHIQALMVQQNALGRKTGHGFYQYRDNSSADDIKRQAPIPMPSLLRKDRTVLLWHGSHSYALGEICRACGFRVETGKYDTGQPAVGMIALAKKEGLKDLIVRMERFLPETALLICQCVDVTLTEIATWVEHPERLVGFDSLFLANGPITSLVASPVLINQARTAAEAFFISLGKEPIWISDSPALVLPRIVCMLANEAAFAAGESVAEIDAIDKAMQLGTNYPKGPFAWANELSYITVVEILDHLHDEYGEERYRVAPLLRRWARLRLVSA
jgi:3-hydroxybutyryl-CoA dehydrogenase